MVCRGELLHIDCSYVSLVPYCLWLVCICVSGADDSVPAAALERESQSHERTAVFPTGTVTHLTAGLNYPSTMVVFIKFPKQTHCVESHPTWHDWSRQIKHCFLCTTSGSGEKIA